MIEAPCQAMACMPPSACSQSWSVISWKTTYSRSRHGEHRRIELRRVPDLESDVPGPRLDHRVDANECEEEE